MSLVDKGRLAEALKLNGKKASTFDFAFSHSLDEDVLQSLCVSEVGIIPVPISLMDIERLKSVTELEHSIEGHANPMIIDNQIREIDAQSVNFSPQNFLQSGISSLAATAMCHLGINPGILAIEAHLDKLSLIPPGGCMKSICVLKREPGMFASMILQIPVEGGHTGGMLKVQLGSKSMVFDCELGESHKFNLTAIYVGCVQELETVKQGWMVTLSFNLVWKNAMAMADSPLPLPTLLAVLNEIAESLKSWTTPADYEPMRLKVDVSVETSAEEIIASVLDTSSLSDRLDYSPALLSSNSRYSSENSNMLFFLLEEKYSIADLGFADLIGQDQLLARIFNCSLFLDIHLAVITQHVTGVLDYCDLDEGKSLNQIFKIEHWINSTNTLIKLKGIEFDLRTQLMGNMQKIKNYIIPEQERKILHGMPRSFSCNHPVLVIWPKPQTIRIYCQYGFNAVLDRMEAAVDISSNRQELIGDLGIVLSFCRTEPLKVWGDPTVKPGQRTYRLLRLCQFLRARDEGLELLDLLGTDFSLDGEKSLDSIASHSSSNLSVYEGIRSEDVAEAIAEFQCLISGWVACFDRILKLITPNRIVGQLTQLINLVKHILNRFCFEGGIQLMDSISSTLSDLEPSFAASLNQPELDAFVDQIIAMEADPRTSNPLRLARLVSLFPRLDFDQQCHLVVDLQKENFLRLRGVQSCLQMFRDLCLALPLSDLQTTGPATVIIVQLLKCFLNLGDENLVQSLTDQICTTHAPSLEPTFHKSNLLEAVLSSSEIWELVSTSQLAKNTVVSLVTARLSFLVSLVDQPLPVLSDEVNARRYEPVRHSWMMELPQEATRASLTACIHLVFRLERETAFENQKGLDSLAELYTKLSLEQLCHLVLDLRELDGNLLKDNPVCFSLVTNLCQLLVNKCKEALPQIPHEIIIEVVKTFIWLGDVMLVRSLVKQICLAGSGGSWDPTDKNNLLETILSSVESWCKMGPSSSRLVRDSSTALIGAWIVGLCRILDQVGAKPTLTRKTDGLRSKIATCVNIFIRTEKSQPRSDQPNVATFFTLLLSKLSLERLCHLILDLRKLDAVDSSSTVLKLPPCSDIYRDLCRLLVTKELSLFIKSYGWLVTELWKCFHWFADEDIFMTLSHKILDAFLPTEENPLVAKIVSSTDLRSLASTSPYGKAAFCLFLDQRINRLKTMTKPFLSWDHPYAVVPGHPEVEAFLRSTQKSMTYSYFPTFASACKFSVRVGGIKNGYCVQVDPVKVGKRFRCKIEKMLSRNALLKKVTDDLVEFRETLMQPDGAGTKSSPNVGTTNPPEKIVFKREVVSDDEEICVAGPTKRAREEPAFLVSAVDY